MMGTCAAGIQTSVIGHAGVELRTRGGKAVDHEAAEAEADGADLAGRLGVALQERHRGDQRRDRVVLVHLRMQLARRVLAGWCPAHERKHVDRIRQVTFGREPAGDILEVRIEAAVLMDDQNDRALALGLGARQVAVDLALGRIVGEPLGREARVVGRDHRGMRVIILQQRQQRAGGGRRARERGQSIEKFTPGDAAMGETVVEIDDSLVHGVSPC